VAGEDVAVSKNLYIYNYVSRVTTNYHNGGSLVIITSGDPQNAWVEYCVRRAEQFAYDKDGELKLALTELGEPNRVIAVAGSEPDEIFVFADAGCC